MAKTRLPQTMQDMARLRAEQAEERRLRAEANSRRRPAPRTPDGAIRAGDVIGLGASATDPRAISVIVTTHRRPEDLRRLLGDLHAEAGALDVAVDVWEDPAPGCDYSSVRELIAGLGRPNWKFHTAKGPVGKKGYAQWLTGALRASRTRQPTPFVMVLQDDVRLCRGFFKKAFKAWKRLPRGTATLQLFRDAGRQGKPSWTGVVPQPAHGAIATAWVDCLFIAAGLAVDALLKQPPVIPPSRWQHDPARSSGFGEHFSRLLHGQGARMYCVAESLLAHVGQDSRMNPEARRANPSTALRFADGDAVHREFLDREPITACLASIPSRVGSLKLVIASLLHQVDAVKVYLNGYADVPAFLNHPRIEVARSQDHSDRGDAGKFYWVSTLKGYVLTVDDDIVYPPDYARTLVRALAKRGRKGAVAVHGCKLKLPLRSYYRDRHVYGFFDDIPQDVLVDVIGTGTTAFHTSSVNPLVAHFTTGFMADIHLAVWLKARKLPAAVIAHRKDWLTTLEHEDTLYGRFHRKDTPQTDLLRTIKEWSARGPHVGVRGWGR